MRWTHEERVWLKNNYYLQTVEECASQLSRTPNAVRLQVQYLRKRGWKFSRPPKVKSNE
jgi:hypothetical protein